MRIGLRIDPRGDGIPQPLGQSIELLATPQTVPQRMAVQVDRIRRVHAFIAVPVVAREPQPAVLSPPEFEKRWQHHGCTANQHQLVGINEGDVRKTDIDHDSSRSVCHFRDDLQA